MAIQGALIMGIIIVSRNITAANAKEAIIALCIVLSMFLPYLLYVAMFLLNVNNECLRNKKLSKIIVKRKAKQEKKELQCKRK